MKRLTSILCLAVLLVVCGCEQGPPTDNSKVVTPPKPAPPSGPGN